MEGSLVAYKVFTNGSVLQASEVNENLMQQAVATFSNASARSAAITSPVEGQMTYLIDADRYDHWNGSAWASPYGLTLLRTVNVTAGTTSLNVDSIFTSEYRNYMFSFNLIGTTDTVLRFRMRSGTSTISGSNYSRQILTANDSVISGARVSNDTLSSAADLSSVSATSMFYLFDPAVAQQTTATYQANSRSTLVFQITSTRHTLSTAYDGINFFPDAGTFSGAISIYGLRA
jgi:hypothetical protein